MPKICVITRHLEGCRPVATSIIFESTDPEVTNMSDYFLSVSNEVIEGLKNNIPEFINASFYVDILNT